MPGDDGLETFHGAGRRVLLQQQMKHRHEMALAAAEAPVQVRRLAGAGRERAPDQVERPVEGAGELRRHDVGPERLGGPGHALREPQDEIVAMDPFRDVDQVADQCHVEVFRRLPRLPRPSGGAQARMASRVSESARASSSMNPSK